MQFQPNSPTCPWQISHMANVARVHTLAMALAKWADGFCCSCLNHNENALLICLQTNEVQQSRIGQDGGTGWMGHCGLLFALMLHTFFHALSLSTSSLSWQGL